MSVVVVKLGSSVVAEDSGELRAPEVARVCAEVAELQAAGTNVVIVTSGAIARGMHILGLPARPTGIEQLQGASAVGQGRLYRTYDDLLSERGVQTAQVLLTFFDMSARTHYLNARRTLQALLDWRIVPVINENDTTTTDEISFGDNDFLAAQVAVLLQARLLVLLTQPSGVFSADPRLDPGARLIEEITDFETLDAQVGHTMSALGSGGMRSKVVAAEMATAAGIETIICSGFEPGSLLRAAAGERVGTRCLPRSLGISSFKLWLRYAKPSHGRVLVDAGAERALRDGAASLLPVGITAVEGDFDAGDAVDVVGGGPRIGKGICNYSADELRQVAGRKSSAVRQILRSATDEAVHRDYFVLD
ncbi:MAG: glutamate 5-kinase [Solirubrobacteraceae bacterium]|jgi:glutamate 5-kinase|nr:glutamate 5-kinase [Solirubrobacteraceae bacterium]